MRKQITPKLDAILIDDVSCCSALEILAEKHDLDPDHPYVQELQELMKIERQCGTLEPTSLGPVSFGPVDIIESEPQPLSATEIADLIETLIETCHEMELCGAEELQQLGIISDDLRTMQNAEEEDLEAFITEHMQHFVQLWPMIQLMFTPTLARPGDENVDDEQKFHFDEFTP